MTFNSLEFWLCLPVLLLLYRSLAKAPVAARQLLLLLASYAFYGYFDVRFLAVLWASTAVDFIAARGMEQATLRGKRLRLAFSLAVNLGLLGYFKYASFFVDSAAAMLQGIGLPAHPVALHIVMPVGISFYTFQTISYTVDVYRGRSKAERSPLSFALFVAFFPQLMAGPIERARDLLPQLHTLTRPSQNDLKSGFRLFLFGLVKKVFISGVLFAHAYPLYLNPDLRTTAEAWSMGAMMLIHIYMDFSGYSDMAVGLGRMLGVRLSRNFSDVFRATSLPDLWRRWHMTLGRWFRDYVLLPCVRMGIPKRAAILLTFSLIGLWHGPQWTFVVWGVLMGVGWIVDDATRWQARLTSVLPLAWARVGQTAATLSLFIFVSQLFAVSTLSEGLTLMQTMLGWAPEATAPFTPLPRAALLGLVAFVGLEFLEPRLRAAADRSPAFARAYDLACTGLAVPLAILLSIEGVWTTREFVYFTF